MHLTQTQNLCKIREKKIRKEIYYIRIGYFETKVTHLEVDESVDEADDDSDDFGGGGGFSGGLFFGGLPLGAGVFFGVVVFFVGVSSSLSDELSGEKMLFFFELAGDFVLVLLALFLLAAALFIC